MSENRGRLRRVLCDPDVNRWHANLAERSELTADIYARRLDRFCEEFKTTPAKLWALDSKIAYNFLVDAVRVYRNKKLTGSTIKGYLKPIISWLRENDIILTRPVNISGTDKTPTLEDEKSPEPYELHSVWRFCNPRQTALIALEAFTGCRPQVFGNYKGDNGLRFFDLPELEVNGEAKKVIFRIVPTRVVVRQEISKEGNQYETFLCEEGCVRLAAYLERRMQLGEVLRPDSAVIADDDGEGRTLTTKSMYEIVKTPFRHAGLPWRPYILRRYADVRLGQAAATVNFLSEFATHTCSHHRPVRNAKGEFQFTIPIVRIAVKIKDHVCILDPDRATKRFLTAVHTKQQLDRTLASMFGTFRKTTASNAENSSAVQYMTLTLQSSGAHSPGVVRK